MMSTVRRRTRIAWIALSAMLMSMLAPGVSHMAMAAAAGIAADGALGEICSVDDPGRSSSAKARPAPESQPANHGVVRAEHCPYCLSHAGGTALPSASLAFEAPAWRVAAVPRRFLHAPAARYPWLAAQPRAPPARA